MPPAAPSGSVTSNARASTPRDSVARRPGSSMSGRTKMAQAAAMGLQPPTPSVQDRRSELGKPGPPKEEIKQRPERTETSTAKDASREFDRSQLVPKMDTQRSKGISEGLADMDDRDLL